MRSTSSTARALAVALLCTTAAGCAGSGTGGPAAARSRAAPDGLTAETPSRSAPSPPVSSDAGPSPPGRGEVSARSTGLGTILVDGAGRTLYLFEGDKENVSTCTGPCVTVWPPLTVAGNGRAAAGSGGVKERLLATTTRSDGARQVTYNGHPLYTFEDDHKPGDTNGQGDISFHHRWYVVDTAGNRNTTPQQDTGGLY
ncbi:COG4315 family predicted lipoprotein [Streptomyces sp. NPDC001840]